MNETGGVCIHSERQDVALELCAAARSLGVEGPVVAVLVGKDAEGRAAELIAHGADHALVADHGEVESLERAVARNRPRVVLVGATIQGAATAAQLAQRLGVGCASECTRVEWRDGAILVERACLGRFVERLVVDGDPGIVTVPPRRFDPLPRGDGTPDRVSRLDVTGRELDTVIEVRRRERSAKRIDKAEVIVAVGRGLKSAADLRMIEELAEALGGAVGASRPLTDDLQWLQPDAKIGLSGVTVKPKLYVACGISGQIEHVVGMRESAVVVAVNSDASAPIMERADYRVTGDLYRIVPALTRAIREFARSPTVRERVEAD